ncbi:protein YgfX [Nitrincola sp.]|uniref:protein YgfX n=1 Tax=Nitrincola sp. TaxID=1926584 RepID=UPI003A951FC2
MSGFSQLNIKVSVSRSLIWGLVFVHLCASLAVLLATIPVPVKFVGIMLSALLLWRCLYELLVADHYITALSCCPDEEWLQIYNRNGDVFNVEYLNHSASLPFLLVLYLSVEGGHRHWFLVPRDAVTLNVFRRLRVVLTHHRTLSNLAR